jgi:hypothetical protein
MLGFTALCAELKIQTHYEFVEIWKPYTSAVQRFYILERI